MTIYERLYSDSPMWSLLVATVDRLRDIDFDTGHEGRAVIRPEDIVIIKNLRDKEFLARKPHLPKPGILVAPIEQNIPVNEGTDDYDITWYRCVAMLTDTSNDLLHGGLRTWTKWQDQISRALRWHDFGGALFSPGRYEFIQMVVQTIETLDDVADDVRDVLKSGVMVSAQCTETRSGTII